MNKKRKKELLLPTYWKVVATILGVLFIGTGAMQLITSSSDWCVYIGVALLVLLVFGILVLWRKTIRKYNK